MRSRKSAGLAKGAESTTISLGSGHSLQPPLPARVVRRIVGLDPLTRRSGGEGVAGEGKGTAQGRTAGCGSRWRRCVARRYPRVLAGYRERTPDTYNPTHRNSSCGGGAPLHHAGGTPTDPRDGAWKRTVVGERRARRTPATAHSDLRPAEPASPNLKRAPPAAAPGPARCGVRPAPSLHGALLLPRRRRDLAPLPSSRRRGRRRRAARALELRCLLPAASSPPVSSRRPGSLLRDPPPSNIRPAGRTRPYDPIPASCARLQGQRVIVVLPSQALPLEGADGCCLLARACCARSVRAGPAGCGWWKGPPLPSAVALCNTLGRRRRAGPVLGRLAVSSQRFVLS